MRATFPKQDVSVSRARVPRIGEQSRRGIRPSYEAHACVRTRTSQDEVSRPITRAIASS
jgi:hypothetical protein